MSESAKRYPPPGIYNPWVISPTVESPQMDLLKEKIHLLHLIRVMLPYVEREENGTRTGDYTRWVIAAAKEVIE